MQALSQCVQMQGWRVRALNNADRGLDNADEYFINLCSLKIELSVIFNASSSRSIQPAMQKNLCAVKFFFPKSLSAL